MKLAFFQGCNIPARIEQYASSLGAVMDHFGVELAEVPEFTCCGYPMRNINERAYLLPSVRNLAIAEQKGLDICVACNCCFQSLQKARRVMERDPKLASEYNLALAEEGLEYTGTIKVRHFLEILHGEIGLEKIAAQAKLRFIKTQVAVLHGCHLLRPREITRFDNSFVPKITADLLGNIGLACSEWNGSLECCGASLAGFNDELSQGLLEEKFSGAMEAGAELIVPICAYCYLQLDQKQKPNTMPVLLIPQLLGLCLGLDAEALGIEKNSSVTPQFLAELYSRLGEPGKKKKKVAGKSAAVVTE